jgi:hypothetical protein
MAESSNEEIRSRTSRDSGESVTSILLWNLWTLDAEGGEEMTKKKVIKADGPPHPFEYKNTEKPTASDNSAASSRKPTGLIQ